MGALGKPAVLILSVVRGAFTGMAFGFALIILFASQFIGLGPWKYVAAAGLTLAATLVGAAASYIASKREAADEHKVQRAEERVAENPGKPGLAWDLARIKLESYLDRNLSHLRSIFVLTVAVMLAGFCIIAWGIWQATLGGDAIPVAAISAASGVLVSFVGGSFLVVYKSVLSQSKDYVTVLERINAVGMAVQILSTIDTPDGEIRNRSTAALAAQLLAMYSTGANTTRS